MYCSTTKKDSSGKCWTFGILRPTLPKKLFVPKLKLYNITMASSQTSSQIIAKLGLSPHPEGGFHYRDSSIILSRSQLPSQYKVDHPMSTSIYFLLPSGSVSNLHRIPMAETWHFYLGEPLVVVELYDIGTVKLNTDQNY